MAGKTLLGIGNEGRRGRSAPAAGDRGDPGAPATPQEDDEARVSGVDDASTVPVILPHMSSEPTIVDDEKVKEGLRRLSSLDSSNNAALARGLGRGPSANGGDHRTPGLERATLTDSPRLELTPSPIPGLVPATPPLARTLDGIVPLPPGLGEAPATPVKALIESPQAIERGTRHGREVHAPAETGGRGREATLTPTQQPVVKAIPRSAARPQAGRGRAPARRPDAEEAAPPRSRPNLAARVTIVLATAAAVALLGVAGLRWQQDNEGPTSRPTRAAEWPSSEGTAPAHVTETQAPTPAAAPLPAAVPTTATEAENKPEETETAPPRKAQAFPVAPPVKVVRIDGSEGRRRAEARAEQVAPTHASTDPEPRSEGARPPLVRETVAARARETEPVRAREAVTATPNPSPRMPASPPPAVVLPSNPPRVEARTEPKAEPAPPQPPPFKPAPRKDDPDSTLPLDE